MSCRTLPPMERSSSPVVARSTVTPLQHHQAMLAQAWECPATNARGIQ